MLIDLLQETVLNNRNDLNFPLLRNLLKETLQLQTLNFIYNSKYGKNFLFKGGTCLRFCFDLPRLSEDLDFDIKEWDKFSLTDFTEAMTKYFRENQQFRDFNTKIAGNKREIFLQFNVMKKLGLADRDESDKLFLRIDISPLDSRFYKEELSIKSTPDFSLVIKRYSLEDLFASKIAAIIQRSFKKGKGNLITFKGRDYFDLIWFLEKRVVPNWERLKEITGLTTKEKIVRALEEKVASIKTEYLQEDLLPLFKESSFVNNFTKNFSSLYKSYKQVLL